MKNTINRLLSAAVAAAMLFCTAVSSVSAAELGTYDAVVSIVYPRPDEAPQKPVITESGTEIELPGCFWKDNMNSDKLIDFMRRLVHDSTKKCF